MTYGKLKQRIYSLLDLNADTGVVNGCVYDAVSASMDDAVNSAMRKIAAMLMCVIKRTRITFVSDGALYKATLPDDFISVKAVYAGGKKHTASKFDAVGGALFCSDIPYGTADMFYYARPVGVSELDDYDELEFDDMHCDIAAYGAALELCGEAYPGNYEKYVVIATEYDERMANALLYGGRADRVSNSVYAKRRLI